MCIVYYAPIIMHILKNLVNVKKKVLINLNFKKLYNDDDNDNKGTKFRKTFLILLHNTSDNFLLYNYI